MRPAAKHHSKRFIELGGRFKFIIWPLDAPEALYSTSHKNRCSFSKGERSKLKERNGGCVYKRMCWKITYGG